MFTALLKRTITTTTVTLCLLLSSTISVSAEPPEVMLENLSRQMINTLKAERETIRRNPVRLFEIVEKMLVPHVDMQRMSRWVLGKHWRTASTLQKQRFTREFQHLLVRFYSAALLEDPNKLDEMLANLDENIISFQPARFSKDAKQSIVKATVHLNDGPEIPVSFRLYKSSESWKVIDVTVDGISMITNYRSSFATEIRRDGLEAMINKLSDRNRELLEQSRNARPEARLTS